MVYYTNQVICVQETKERRKEKYEVKINRKMEGLLESNDYKYQIMTSFAQSFLSSLLLVYITYTLHKLDVGVSCIKNCKVTSPLVKTERSK